MGTFTGGPSTPIEQVTELGDGIIQKLVTAGITTVEALADMTPEQLEEIPGIGEKTLEKISVAVRHYFGHFEEGEEGHVPASIEATADGEAEVETAPAVVEESEAETENAAVVMEEAESTAAVEADEEPVSAMEEAIESVPEAKEEDGA
jgi:N utilization substance protein A